MTMTKYQSGRYNMLQPGLDQWPAWDTCPQWRHVTQHGHSVTVVYVTGRSWCQGGYNVDIVDVIMLCRLED